MHNAQHNFPLINTNELLKSGLIDLHVDLYIYAYYTWYYHKMNKKDFKFVPTIPSTN